MGYKLLNTHNYELRICFWRKHMLAVSQHQWDQWEIFLLLSAKSDAENSTVLADSKLISIFRQSKQETQFIKICSETQKAIPEKNFWGSCVFSPCFYKLRASSRGFFLWGEVPCFLLFNYFLNNSAKLRYNLAVYPCDCSHTQYYNCYFCSATKLQSNLD